MRRLAVVFVLCALVLGGCLFDRDDPDPSNGCGLRAGTSEHTMDVGGTEREYVVVAPTGITTGKPRPVLYLFHGLGSSDDETLAYSGLGELVNERNMIVVAPQALGDPATWDTKGVQADTGRDAEFIDRLKSKIEGSHCAESKRQYVAGLSNGSAISFALACRKEPGFAGFAGVSATFYESACSQAPTADILYFHGTGDKVVPFGGGKTPLFPVRAATTVIDDWAKHDRCDAKPRRTSIGSDVTRYIWSGCADGKRLRYYVIAGGGHTWPGATLKIPPLGNTTSTINASKLIVDFFDL